jgi:[acyl-carrier-protein] S-malonyltransferase
MNVKTEGQRTIAYVFPGQGSQFVGMGRSLVDHSPAARKIFEQADATLGFRLSDLCFNGPREVLDDTINAQPAILTVSAAALAALNERLGPTAEYLKPRLVAGHSMGEYSALVAAGVVDFPVALQLVRERGRLMKETGEHVPGGMAAVIGLDARVLEEVCQKARQKGIVCPANYNSPGQTVISGDLVALSEAIELAIAQGARRVVRLAVSIAAHSPIMQLAADQFNQAIARFHLQDARIPVVSDVSARVVVSADEIRAELSRQLYSSVLWTDTVRQMVAEGVNTFVEIGPGEVLSTLIRRIDRESRTLNVGDLASLQEIAHLFDDRAPGLGQA